MFKDNPPECGARGRLCDADVIKLQNLARPGGITNWDDQELTCRLPEGHEVEEHEQFLVEQDFGRESQLWWATWHDVDGLREEAAMFTGPICDFTHQGWTCLLLAGHTTPDDQRHMLA
ncbi:hypothetical protein [Streptomyces yunnanensis]|uniref:Uncharacterized protein n=1 Tax=Streptomyces yunnanensis TaxID=156453 RepID=A0A9X8MTF2_9ACTN|nr:hypothetical protein [Streptomyces yunnanensis]SHL76470.1 hypothetical protein SAMN05216268_106116 [Streptomyces yunnanensis]